MRGHVLLVACDVWIPHFEGAEFAALKKCHQASDPQDFLSAINFPCSLRVGPPTPLGDLPVNVNYTICSLMVLQLSSMPHTMLF